MEAAVFGDLGQQTSGLSALPAASLSKAVAVLLLLLNVVFSVHPLERFAASKGFSCHQGKSFDVKRLGIENCTCGVSGKAKQRKLVEDGREEENLERVRCGGLGSC